MIDDRIEGLKKTINKLVAAMLILSFIVAAMFFSEIISPWLERVGFYTYAKNTYANSFNSKDVNTELLKAFLLFSAAGVWCIGRKVIKMLTGQAKDKDDDDGGATIKA